MKKSSSGKASSSDGTPAKPPSMWVRNAQLAFFTIVIGTIQMGATSAASGGSEGKPLLHGFTTKVWIMVVNNAVGGLCVAFVIKYADNILKGFACAIATVLASLAAVPLFGFSLSPIFGVGMAVVLSSTLIYGGTVKIPVAQDWWYTEPDACRSLRTSSSRSGYAAVSQSESKA